jgi:tetratricopeptide (TPR) repeat protein
MHDGAGPESNADYKKGLALLEGGKHQAAVRLLEELAKQNPHVQAFQVVRTYAIGCLRQAAGDEQDATRHFRRTLAMDPYFGPARQALENMQKQKKPESFLGRLFGK